MNRSSLPIPLLPLCVVLAACGGSSDANPGEETSPCNDGRCLGDLECRSDLCVDPDQEPTDTDPSGADTSGGDASDSNTSGSDDDSDTSTPTEPITAVDILFVLDNSGTMGEEQANISANIASLVGPLADDGLSLRVAVTTTDNSNYWCRGSGISDPEAGRFVLSSCQSRLGDFYFSGTDTNAEEACTAYCDANSLQVLPSDTPGDPTSRIRPWIEVDGSGQPSNLMGTTLNDALACALPQGINGCGFESTLESMWKALRRAQEENEGEFDFMREDAHLMVVLVSDEADCSFNSDFEEVLFGEEGVGNQVFWSLPDVQQSPSSAVCWNAGVRCPNGDCEPENYAANGSTTTDPDQAVLYPVDKYVSFLSAVRSAKNQVGAELFVFGLLGVPEDYPQTGVLTYAEGPDANDPASFQARFGIGQGCSSSLGEAVPPVRSRSLIESDAMSEHNQIYSICSPDYGPALKSMAQAVVDYDVP